MQQVLTIPAKFNGPPGSGNGGYCCGMLAKHLPGSARIRLQVPPPLGVELQLRVSSDKAELRQSDTLVGFAIREELDMAVPPAPTLAQAEDAASRYACHEQHPFPTCYVCGTERHSDGMCLYPGPVDDWSLLACPWQPRTDMLDQDGNVQTEIVWAALDCPGYFGAMGAKPLTALLGELTGEVGKPVPGNEALIVYCWPLGQEGRKSWGGTAIATQSGEVLARSHTLWITLKA